jgi:hypothetical protein
MEFIFVINISAEEPSAKKDLYFLVWEWEGKGGLCEIFFGMLNAGRCGAANLAIIQSANEF